MKYQTYPEYKDSGVEWPKAIPQHWKRCPLKFFARIRNGQDYKAVEAEKGFPVMGSGGQFTHASDYMYDRESVLLGRKGTIDKPLYINEPFWTVDTMYYTEIQTGVSAKFVYYLSLTIPFGRYATNTALPSMTQENLGNNQFVIPSILPEQIQIAKFLDYETGKIDRLIEKQQELIALLKEKRQAVISHAVTKGLNPNAPMKPSGIEWLGDVPEHWEVTRIGLLFGESSQRASTALALEFPILSVSIHHGISDSELSEGELDRKVTRSDDRSLYKVVHQNDLAYNMMRAWQGGFGASKLSGLISPAYVVCKPKTHHNSSYFELVLRSPNAVTELKRYSRGITDFRLRLYWEEFKCIEVPVPPEKEVSDILEAILKIGNLYDDLIQVSEQQITLLQERRTALISAAVTGKIDVQSWTAPEEPVQNVEE